MSTKFVLAEDERETDTKVLFWLTEEEGKIHLNARCKGAPYRATLLVLAPGEKAYRPHIDDSLGLPITTANRLAIHYNEGY